MANEKVTLTWHSHTSHFQGVLGNLFDTGESSDVTLVCDDQVKFKAHKFILKSCSPVFESILSETNDSKSVVYLRGVNQLELKPILNFIYFGQASFYQERMRDFLKTGKDLQIKDIKEVPEEDEVADNGENIVETQQDDISEEVLSDDNVDENEIGSFTASSESSQQALPSDSSPCPKCNVVFTHRKNMQRHFRYEHQGIRFTCKDCDYEAKQKFHLIAHIAKVHDGVKYPCSQCAHKATTKYRLKRHIESVHEGVKYPCRQCDFKATQQYALRRHIELKHKLLC